MFIKSYLQTKQKILDLQNYLEAKLHSAQEVTIKDLYVLPRKGEKKKTDATYRISYLQRIIDQIEILIGMANLYHEKHYCYQTQDARYEIKPEARNAITRIITTEFSFYGKNPLSFEQFELLFDAILVIAGNQQPNVHALISSVPLLNNDSILNISFYVQCGREPKIQVFAKAVSSNVDYTYPNATNFSQQNSAPDIRLNNLSEFIAGAGKHNLISSNSVFEATTLDGVPFWIAIDVCYDHFQQHAKRTVENRVKRENLDTKIFPLLVDHIVTSSTIKIIEESCFAKHVVHVDEDETLSKISHRESRKVSHEDLNTLLKHKYSNFSFHKTMLGVLAMDPPFGPHYLVVEQDERVMSGFKSDFQQAIKRHNNLVLKDLVKSYLIENGSDMAMHDNMSKTVKNFSDNLQLLYRKLRALCGVRFIDCIIKDDTRPFLRRLIQFSQDLYSTISEKDPVYLVTKADELLADLATQLNDAKKPNNSAVITLMLEAIKQERENIFKELKQYNDCDKAIQVYQYN